MKLLIILNQLNHNFYDNVSTFDNIFFQKLKIIISNFFEVKITKQLLF